ncbi:uncharacterized protein LOC120898342 [Anopheles arabiensis]|uniref:uncharacterized protein LOC120898342 n=1 Tax=Anopheles arabiensis TaxID=7173 RepID=UPI001AADC1D2|nr:uncharacterized protein LOC120898342 [Anopheles arabiensis]XP_049464985.1 uncharacterized protein LOC120959353 [Anopheles coluzzii]XP_049464986.1 uncharacterized protein LOC125907362 [Anopheles coluzzii]
MAGPSGGGWGHGPPPVNKRGRQAPEWLDPANVHGELRYLILAPQKGFAIPKNAFLIEKSLSPFVGPIEPCVPMDQGARYLMKTRSREQFDKLLAIKKLIDGTPVEITSDRARNTVQCVMVTPCLDGLTDEEILAQIEGTKIVEVKRFMRKVDGAVKPTNAYLLRVDSVTVPEEVRVGCISVRTRPYYPRPMICFKCLIVGHTTARCNSAPACPNCSMPEHGSCNNPPRCKNCKGDHATLNRSCPVYLAEQNIIRIKVDNCISYPEARKIYSQFQQVIEERDFLKSQLQSRRKNKHTENADSNHTDSNSDSNADANSSPNMDTNGEQNIDSNNTNANNNTNTDANTATQKDSKTSTSIGPKRKASPSSSSYSTVDTTSEEKIPHGNNSTPSKTKSHKRGKRRSQKRKLGFRH